MKKLRKVDARGWMGRAVGLKGRVLGGWRGAGTRLSVGRAWWGFGLWGRGES